MCLYLNQSLGQGNGLRWLDEATLGPSLMLSVKWIVSKMGEGQEIEGNKGKQIYDKQPVPTTALSISRCKIAWAKIRSCSSIVWYSRYGLSVLDTF